MKTASAYIQHRYFIILSVAVIALSCTDTIAGDLGPCSTSNSPELGYCKDTSSPSIKSSPKCVEAFRREREMWQGCGATENKSIKSSPNTPEQNSSPLIAAPPVAPTCPTDRTESINTKLSMVDNSVGEYLQSQNSDPQNTITNLRIIMWATREQAQTIKSNCPDIAGFSEMLAAREATFQQAEAACRNSASANECQPMSPSEISMQAKADSSHSEYLDVPPSLNIAKTDSNPYAKKKTKLISAGDDANQCVDYRDGHINNDCPYAVNTVFCVYHPQPLNHFNAFDHSEAFDCSNHKGDDLNGRGGGLTSLEAESKDGSILFGEKILIFSCKSPMLPVHTVNSTAGVTGDCQ